MHVVTLLGVDHTELGSVAIASAESVAIGISRGRYPKGYEYTDPNEDAVAAISDGSSALLVVADGHNGTEASHALIKTTADLTEAPPIGEPSDILARLVGGVIYGVVDSVARLTPPRDNSATAAGFISVIGGLGAAMSIADCATVLIRGHNATALTPTNGPFLGNRLPARLPRTYTFRPEPGDILVTATDGLSNFLGRTWLDQIATLAANASSLEVFVESAIESAGRSGAGDNIAVAAFRHAS